MDRERLIESIYRQMSVETADDGSRVIRLEGALVGRLRRDPETRCWKYEWCSHDDMFHAGASELEGTTGERAEKWAAWEIATLLAMRTGAMERALDDERGRQDR